MKKKFTFLILLMLPVLTLFAQPVIPAGYESIYSVFGVAEKAPLAVAAKGTPQLFGSANGWGESLAFDLTDYQMLAIKITYDTLDAGKQVALRFSANKVVKLVKITLPEADSVHIIKLNLPDYANAEGLVQVGGILLYNGSTHWSITYDGEPATKECTIEYVAVKKKVKIPNGYVSIYSLKPEEERAPITINALSDYQIIGPVNWGPALDYDVTNYDSLAFKFTFDAADAGKEIAIRFSANAAGVKIAKITLPLEGTTHIEKLRIADYANADGKVRIGGIYLYNGKSHWTFTYTNPTTMPIKMEYVALKTVPAEGLAIEAVDADLAKALPFDISTTLKTMFTPINTTNQTVTWSSDNENMATVDENGVVTAKKIPGAVVIKAVSKENETLKAEFTITIVGAATAVTGVSLAQEEVNLKIGFETTLEYQIQPLDASIKTVSWASSDTLVAKVNEVGKITSIGVGKAQITVTTKDGSLTDVCTVNIIGYKEIPIGYVSLYTLEYNEQGTLKGMNTLSSFPAAPVPGMFNTNKDIQTGSVLGTQYNWNKFDKYCDVSPYSELVVAATFKKEDIGKTFKFRYAFSTSSADVNGGSITSNREVTIDQEDMLFIVDLDSDTTDVENIKHLGAIKFQTISEELWFVVDYVALEKSNLSSESRLSGIQLEGLGMFGFSSSNYTYNFGVKVPSITITATAMDANANVKITNNGIIHLDNTKATPVTITVTAEDGTKLVYTLNITTSAVTSVENIDQSGMKVYPTYSNGIFNVELGIVPGTISVYDLAGNCIMKKYVHTSHDKIYLKPGLFIVKLQSNGVSKTVKVVCTH